MAMKVKNGKHDLIFLLKKYTTHMHKHGDYTVTQQPSASKNAILWTHLFLAYFQKIKLGLSNHQPVCLCVPH
jgi:hypothetical protein